MWGEKAEAVFDVELVEHVTAGTWLKALVDVLTQSTPDTPGLDLNVKSRASGEVVYSVELSAGIAADEGFRVIEGDLKSLSLAEFCEKYGIAVPEERV